MSEDQKTNAEVSKTETDGGLIIFADDVVATIAALAVSDVEGVSAMTGGVVEGFTEMLGKKNLTKGVKVEVGAEEAAVDVWSAFVTGTRFVRFAKRFSSRRRTQSKP